VRQAIAKDELSSILKFPNDDVVFETVARLYRVPRNGAPVRGRSRSVAADEGRGA